MSEPTPLPLLALSPRCVGNRQSEIASALGPTWSSLPGRYPPRRHGSKCLCLGRIEARVGASRPATH